MGSIYEAMRITTKPNETCGELYEAVHEQYGISLRGFQMRFANVTGNSFAKNREVTAKEKAAIREAYPPKEILKRTATVRMKAGESPALKAAPGYLSRLGKWYDRADFVTPVFRALFGAGILAHSLLILYECWYLWEEAGFIAGAVVALVIWGAIILMATDRHKAHADNLLWFVWFLDGAAWFVHSRAMYHSGTNAYGAGITEFGTGCLAAIVCLCAMALLYFYKETGKK